MSSGGDRGPTTRKIRAEANMSWAPLANVG
jgi:hypothetical protein